MAERQILLWAAPPTVGGMAVLGSVAFHLAIHIVEWSWLGTISERLMSVA